MASFISGGESGLGGLGNLLGLGGFGGMLGGSGVPSGSKSWVDYFQKLFHITPTSTIATPPFTNQSGIPGITGTGSTGTNPDGTPKTGTVPKTLLEQIMGMASGIGFPLYGALTAQNENQWNQGAKVNVLNYLRGLGDQAQGNLGVQSQYLPQMLSQMGLSGALSNSTQGQLADNLGTALGNAPGSFLNASDPYSTVPGSQDVINWLGGIQGQNSTALGGLQNSLANGPVAQGQDTALGLSSGNNPYAAHLKQLSDQLTNGQPVGGINSATQQAQNVAGSILGQNPLLSMDQVRSMAIDQNATQSLNAMNKQRRDLLNRTGVTGLAIASGQQNELLGSGMDQALQNQASGVTNAIMGQQGLQNQLYNTGASLFGSAQGAGLNQQQLALQQMLGGAGLLSGNQNTQINALNALSNLGGTQNSGYNALSGLTNNMSNNTLGEGNFLAAIQKLGLDKSTGLYGALGTLLGQQGGLANLSQQGMFNAAGMGQNSYNQNLQFLQSLAGNNTGLFSNAPQSQNYFNAGGLFK